MSNKTSPWVWVGVGCAVLFAGAVAFVAFIVFVVFAAMRSSDPYKDAMQRAQNDPRVMAALGTPIEPGWFISGSINTENRDGNANISIPISGPKQSASIHVAGTKEGGRWTYTRMIVTPATGPTIDLLDGPRTAFLWSAPESASGGASARRFTSALRYASASLTMLSSMWRDDSGRFTKYRRVA